MSNIAITADGGLQFIANGVDSKLEAIQAFDLTVSINPHGKHMADLVGDFEFYELSRAEVAEIDPDDKAFYSMDLKRMDTLKA